jgi:hypothetical protein
MLVWHSLRRKLPGRALSGGSHGAVRRTARGVAEPLELLVSVRVLSSPAFISAVHRIQYEPLLRPTPAGIHDSRVTSEELWPVVDDPHLRLVVRSGIGSPTRPADPSVEASSDRPHKPSRQRVLDRTPEPHSEGK